MRHEPTPPVLPPPGPEYNRENEAQFRAEVGRALREILAELQRLRSLIEE